MSTMDKNTKALTTESSVVVESEYKGILVAVRIRPLSIGEVDAGAKTCCEVFDNSNIVTISQAGVVGSYLKSQAGTVNEYAFDAVFDSSASQMFVYERTAKPFIPKVLAGFNVTVFAYGATSAGKTHTMFGSSRADKAASHAEAGIIPNAIKDVFTSLNFKSKNLSSGEKWEVNLSYIEVYNEQIYDLLVPVPSGKVLSLREDQEKGLIVIAGVIESSVDSLDEVLKLLELGNRNRKTEATLANQVSSRSHAILQLKICHTYRSHDGKDNVVESKLSLIDLAGSERASATSNRGARLMEGANINKSLLALANCINALAENSGTGKKNNVKYRDSKLTLLLKDSLEGKSNLVIIANINPSHVTLEDSHNTLKYANRAKNIKVNPLIKEITKESTWAERESRLKAENVLLKQRILYLEHVIEGLQTSSMAISTLGVTNTSRNALDNDDISTLPMWDKASHSRPRRNKKILNLKNNNGYDNNDDEVEDGVTEGRDRLSNSSTLSSYSDIADMIDFPFGDEYEASLAASYALDEYHLNQSSQEAKKVDNKVIKGKIHDNGRISVSSSPSPTEVPFHFENLEDEFTRNGSQNKNDRKSLIHFSSCEAGTPSEYIQRQSLGKRSSEKLLCAVCTVEDEVEVEEGISSSMDCNTSVCTYTTASSVPIFLPVPEAIKMNENETDNQILLDIEVAMCSVSTGPKPMGVSTDITDSNEIIVPTQTENECEEVKREIDANLLKKRRMSAIPMLARSSSRIMEGIVRTSDESKMKLEFNALPVQTEILENQSTEGISSGMRTVAGSNGGRKRRSEISIYEDSVERSNREISVHDDNAVTVTVPICDSIASRMKSCPLGSRRRSIGIATVTAMLAAIPESLKSSKKDSKITKLNNDVLDLNKYDDMKTCNNDIVKDFSIEKKISSVMTNSSNQNQNKNVNENYIENEIKVSNELFCVGGSSSKDIAAKKVLGPRRMSMRVKQNTNINVNLINLQTQHLNGNENECNMKRKNSINNKSIENTPKAILKRLSASDEKKSITRRKSYLKPSSILKGKGSFGGGVKTALLHSLGEEDDDIALNSDAWLNI